MTNEVLGQDSMYNVADTHVHHAIIESDLTAANNKFEPAVFTKVIFHLRTTQCGCDHPFKKRKERKILVFQLDNEVIRGGKQCEEVQESMCKDATKLLSHL